MSFRGQWPIKSLRGQFLTAFLLCIALPITIVFYYYYASTEKLLIKEVDRSYLQLLNNEVSAMTELTERMLYAANLIANDFEVLEFLKMETSWYSDYYALQKFKLFNRRIGNTGTFMLDGRAVIDVIDTRGYLFSNGLLDDAPRTHDKLAGYGWADDPLVEEGYPLWLTAKAGDLDLMDVAPTVEMLVLVKDIRENYRRSYGTIVIAYPLPRNYADSGSTAADGTERLLVRNGELMAGNAELFAQLSLGQADSPSPAAAGHLVNGQTIDTIGWQLYHASPKQQFTGQLEKLRNQSIVWLFASFVMLIALFVFLVLRIMRPIRQLLGAMSKVGRGDFQLPGEIGGADELKLLHAHFKKMVGNLQETIQRLSEEQRRKEEARFQALQSQIRPHFLLNTLNSIKWSARLSGAEHVSRMINSLGKLLSFAMRQDRETIPLREELEFVRNYVDLQNVRFNNGIKLELDVPEELMDARVNKFTLQPLAENSIIHGGRLPEPLSVRIEARERDGLLALAVSDNGAGVPPAMLARRSPEPDARAPDRAGQLNGIGLANIVERIRLHFGLQYGLTLDNGPDGGAVVRIVIPVRKEELPDA